MHDLEALDAKPRSDLGCAHKLIDIYLAAHFRMLPHTAYILTHPLSRTAIRANADGPAMCRQPGACRFDSQVRWFKLMGAPGPTPKPNSRRPERVRPLAQAAP